MATEVDEGKDDDEGETKLISSLWSDDSEECVTDDADEAENMVDDDTGDEDTVDELGICAESEDNVAVVTAGAAAIAAAVVAADDLGAVEVFLPEADWLACCIKLPVRPRGNGVGFSGSQGILQTAAAEPTSVSKDS
jgi:hypothetical protein